MDFSEGSYLNGHWEWDNENNGLLFISHDEIEIVKAQSSVVVTRTAGCTHTDLDLHFRDIVSDMEQNRFRRTIQRQSSPDSEVEEIVTLRDVKDVVLFTVMSKLPGEFIDMMFTAEADRFFRALIFYFQLFLQTHDDVTARSTIGLYKVRLDNTIKVENILRDNLADLRSMVAREYCFILLGMGNLAKYHHMANKLQTSAPERDIRLFELLMRIATRIVWVALERRSLNLIEHEVGRLFRTEEFNLVTRRVHSNVSMVITPIEKRVLYGEESDETFKLLTRSPLALELLKYRHDFRLLGSGYMAFDTDDERIQFLEAVYTAPEERYSKLLISFGVLGKARTNFDAMIVPYGSYEVRKTNLDHDDKYTLHRCSTLIEVKPYSVVCLPVGSTDSEEVVPDEFPTRKGVFINNCNTKEYEDSRTFWRDLRGVSETRK